jgi:hypothetical protein
LEVQVSKSITQWLKQIGDEKVRIVVNGKVKKVSQTEALARKMFILAKGGIEEIEDEAGNIVEVVHKPDHKVAKSIREWTEGKAAVEPPKEKPKQAKAGQYDSEIGRRLNERLGSGTVEEPESKRPVISKGN